MFAIFKTANFFFYIHYDGGNLPDAEQVTTSVTKVKLDKGATVHFSLKQIEEDIIRNAPSEKNKSNWLRATQMIQLNKFPQE